MPTGENSDHISQEPNNIFLLVKLIINSFKIFFSTKKISFSIFFILSFPLSFFFFLLSFLTFPLKNRIQHLEEVSLFSSIHVESTHLLEEANKAAKSLLFLKVLFFFPIFLLSFFIAVAAVNVASSICSSNNGKPTILTAFTTVKAAWTRVLVTTTCVYATMLACTVVPGMLAAFLETRPFVRVVVEVLGSGLELHMMAVTSLALVVSINEGMYGFSAIRVGSGLMEGKRVCGWVLSGLFVLFSGFIHGTMDMSMTMAMDGSDFKRVESTVVIKLLWDNVVWIFLYALMVQWSFVATTFFYFDLKKRDSIKSDRDSEISLV